MTGTDSPWTKRSRSSRFRAWGHRGRSRALTDPLAVSRPAALRPRSERRFRQILFVGLLAKLVQHDDAGGKPRHLRLPQRLAQLRRPLADARVARLDLHAGQP